MHMLHAVIVVGHTSIPLQTYPRLLAMTVEDLPPTELIASLGLGSLAASVQTASVSLNW